MSFTTLVWNGSAVVEQEINTRLVDNALGQQMKWFMHVMRMDQIVPFRGCYWHLSDDDYFEGSVVKFKHLRGFADGSLEGGTLPATFVYESIGLDQACLGAIREFCTQVKASRVLPPRSYLKALDGVPWEIHLIEDLTAYWVALESYDQARL